jgi:Mg-chelatase subunit ChlD
MKKFLAKNKLLAVVVLYLVVVLVALPITLFNIKEPSQTRSSASAATTLSFSPASYQAAVGATVPIDIMVDPGTNAVSFITLDINYDPAKLSAGTSAFVANPTAFPTIIEGPVYESGRIRVKVSIGADPTKAIIAATKVGTVTFTALADTGGSTTPLTHGTSSYILSVAAGDNATDNVLATVQPAAISIGGTGGPVATAVPTSGGTNPTAVPSDAPTAGPSPTVAVSPTPICTPLPVECTVEGSNCTPPANGYCTDEPTATPGGTGVTPTDIPIACQKVKPADVAVVIDVSGSMKGEKIKNAKASAKSFIKVLQKESNNQVALVTFAKTAKVDVPMGGSFDAINTAIDNITLHDLTCTKCAIEAADDELNTSGRADAQKVIVLLTDGRANTGGSAAGASKTQSAEDAALNAVTNSQTQHLLVYAIGVGRDVNPTFLQKLSASGAYYFAATPIEIDANFTNVYTSLNNSICTGQPILPSITLPVTTGSGGGNLNTVSIVMLTLLLIPVLMLLGHMFL